MSLLQINIIAFRPSDNVIQVNEFDAFGIHVVLELCLRDTQLGHTNFGENICKPNMECR